MEQILTITENNAEDLKDAKVNPKHQDLRVRIWGFPLTL